MVVACFCGTVYEGYQCPNCKRIPPSAGGR